MSRIVVLAVSVMTIAAASGGGYYLYSRTDVVHVAVPSDDAQPAPPAPAAQASRASMHGDFNTRFQPKMPPIYGGGSN